MGRRTWEAQRRERITAPEYIRVAITVLRIDIFGPDSAEVLLYQSYRSDRFNDIVQKSLALTRQDENWLIVGEKVEG